MIQRAEDRPDPTPSRSTPGEPSEPMRREEPRPVPTDEQRPSEATRPDGGGLSTADLAAAGQPRPTTEATANVTPIRPPSNPSGPSTGEHAPLFQREDADGFRSRWTDIQAGFVDEPRRAVEQADQLVADTIQRLASVFADERTQLEGQWDRDGDVSTEDMRIALQRYRSFFDRLLNV